MKTQIWNTAIVFMITLMLIITFVNANTIEIASDETGMEGAVYDTDTLYPYEGFDTFVFMPSSQSFFAPGMIYVEKEKVCLGDKLYWTYYATIGGAGAELDVKQNDADLYEEMKYGGPCTVKTELRKKNGEIVYTGKAWAMGESDYVYKYTSGQHSITYPATSKYPPGDYKLYIYAQCTLPAQYFSYGYVAHNDFIELIDCSIVCPETFYDCDKGQYYKYTYTKVDNECVEHKQTIGYTTLCKKEYCLEQGKYWYDNECHAEEQCTPHWTWGSWGACNPNTETQLRYGNDGCGHTDTQTQSCTPEPDCGDGDCGTGEDCRNCPQDCGDCIEPECGDGICDSTMGETIVSCPDDCKVPIKCGNGECEIGETLVNCPDDCKNEPFCGDGDCDKLKESCENCPQDCGICELCTYDSECRPDNPDKCIDYKCVEGQCANTPILTEECIEPSWWKRIWNEYKYFILGGGAIVTLGIGFVFMIIIAIILYWLFTRQPSGVGKR